MRKMMFSLLAVSLLLAGCASLPVTNVAHPKWTADAVIYEVNMRQYTETGTFEAFDQHLPRLRDLGIDILWFMPIHPIGIEERKGELGSYYSIRDYKDVNPEYGTLEDFKYTVKLAHTLGFHVVLDWVANHTSRDHAWVTEHPDWYVHDSTGVILAPNGWSDVAQLDINNPQVRAAMLDAMKFWVTECGIDGFRCDMAELLPEDAWNYYTTELRKIRSDLFFLAEGEKAYLVKDSFDAYYGWENHHFMNDLAQGTKTTAEYREFLRDHAKRFPQDAMMLNFISNHDENSWAGTEFERMGDAVRQFAALTFALPGMPMLYTGQETGLSKRLEFFQRDPITWEDPMGMGEFYKKLIAMRKAHPSMFAPGFGAPMKEIETSAPDKIFAFERVLGDDAMKAFFNFTGEEVTFVVRGVSMTLPRYGFEILF